MVFILLPEKYEDLRNCNSSNLPLFYIVQYLNHIIFIPSKKALPFLYILFHTANICIDVFTLSLLPLFTILPRISLLSWWKILLEVQPLEVPPVRISLNDKLFLLHESIFALIL